LDIPHGLEATVSKNCQPTEFSANLFANHLIKDSLSYLLMWTVSTYHCWF